MPFLTIIAHCILAKTHSSRWWLISLIYQYLCCSRWIRLRPNCFRTVFPHRDHACGLCFPIWKIILTLKLRRRSWRVLRQRTGHSFLCFHGLKSKVFAFQPRNLGGKLLSSLKGETFKLTVYPRTSLRHLPQFFSCPRPHSRTIQLSSPCRPCWVSRWSAV